MTLDDLTQHAEALIPDKFFFQIAEVCDMTKLPKSVLRFWETEFPMLKPNRTPSGRRMYRRKDVVLLFKIKHLLYEQKYTIDGARSCLDSQRKEPAPAETSVAPVPVQASASSPELVNFMLKELHAIRDLLD